ncbi:uncharacterized protein F4807DRAFT_466949 [Annulohypoxylon truncatum]|uniref:uncharacterized protein n=1 Tax=Annulohypoxylon truncatum TaxID=327061 RepID=UPI00200856E7|nr:uncharacterized protein F4807DRAFT_466949 [Annulohypoxylon truncatum]KAI1210562.1 hypothetical protein F4807DRAFT_466949 [Annulohypoxylon truncatum]
MEVIRTLWPGMANGADNVQAKFRLEMYLFTVEYAYYNLFPVLAAVEDDAPESYEAVANKDSVELEESERKKTVGIDEGLAPQPKPITSGLRSTWLHLHSVGGKRPLLRGVWCWIVLLFAIFVVTSRLSRIPFIPAAVAWPIASMLTLPLYTTWTHIVITELSNKPLWHRLPRLGLVFRAGARAALPYFLIRACEDYVVSSVNTGSILGWLLSLIVKFVIWVCVVIPTHAVFIRVLASLLPEEDRATVLLHRSITSHKAEGKEYLSTLDAWRSFSRVAWKRLFKLYVKTSVVAFALGVVMAVLAAAEFFLMNWITYAWKWIMPGK